MILCVLYCWLLTYCISESSGGSNEFDTYSADECQRVRRPWLSLTHDEQQMYMDALLELRENGGGSVDLDELVAVGSEHEDDFGAIAHTASSYLFWHGYLLWELESRIRNLGGKYKCFAVPYWDFSTEASRKSSEEPRIFGDILGGYGDPENEWTVNGYSWQYTTKQYWVPAHCTAEGDEYPMCTLKRATSGASEMSASDTGKGIIENPVFADFSRWYSASFNLPHNLLTNVPFLWEPVVTSYDPIWYLFHSMVSYHQAIWTDCNDYDLIDPADLDFHPEAYSEFCDSDGCGGMGLDDQMYYGGLLQGKSWSFIGENTLTVRKSYHLARWNVIYDLEDGDGFYTDSGLKEYCDGKLNNQWWILRDYEKNTDKILNDISTGSSSYIVTSVGYHELMIAVFIVISIAFLLRCLYKNKERENIIISTDILKPKSYRYGAV